MCLQFTPNLKVTFSPKILWIICCFNTYAGTVTKPASQDCLNQLNLQRHLLKSPSVLCMLPKTC